MNSTETCSFERVTMLVKEADIYPAFTRILIIPEVLDKGIVANPVLFASPGFH